jgi:hypothetical protein
MLFCGTLVVMNTADFIILKHQKKTPSLAMCKSCEIKFFTPRRFTNEPDEAEAFLWGRFVDHRCRILSFPSPEKGAAIVNG